MKTEELFTIVLTGLMASSLVTAVWAQSPTYKMTTHSPHQITTPDKENNWLQTISCACTDRSSLGSTRPGGRGRSSWSGSL